MTGKELRERREAAGLMQQELADALGVHWTTISRMERSVVKISKATSMALEQILSSRKPAVKKSRKR
jgi:transcriptional regulator with XRE-family HTH domain